MNNVAEEMKHLHKLARENPDKRFNHLWESLTDPKWLVQAWEEIRRNRGSLTPGTDGQTALDVDIALISQWAWELKTQAYRPKPVRRVYIPKANGKTRPLGIPTIKDRTIQQGLKMLLEPIFEADFRECSHGFRQGHSTHTALQELARRYTSTSWIIEGDIEGCFDNIPHAKLLDAVATRISDEKILRLVGQFLAAGYMEAWRYQRTYSGTPQGGILSPLLANIFLQQLDVFVERELRGNQKETKIEQRARRNRQYNTLTSRMSRLAKKLDAADAETRRNMVRTLRQLERERKQLPCLDKDKRHPCKLRYVRYADDFVALVSGNKQEAEKIRNTLREALAQMGLTLNNEKTKITHWRKRVRFLGYDIRGVLKPNGAGIYPVLQIPHEQYRTIIETLQRLTGYHHISETDVITQANAVLRGWRNYFRYANHAQKTFSKLSARTWWMYAHYLARKTKTPSIKALIERETRSGRLKTIERNGKRSHTFRTYCGDEYQFLDLFPPKRGSIRRNVPRSDWGVDLRPVNITGWQRGRSIATTTTALNRANGICEQCHKNAVEHVHHTVPLKGKSFLARVMSDAAQRYTAKALCKKCHLEIHNGSWNRRKPNRNAGYAERCSPSVVTAS